jgi:hydrogenase maturation protease
MRTLVAGLGNVFDSDDGFGVEVARRLADQDWPVGVEVRDFGIRGIHLAYQLLEGYDQVVIVDAVMRGGEPGTLYVIDHPSEQTHAAASDEPMLDTHDLNPDAVLALVPELGGTLGHVVVIGCEPKSLAPGMALSPEVAGSVERATHLVREALERTHGSEADDNGTPVETRRAGGRGRGGRGEPARYQEIPQATLDVTVEP